MEENKNLKIVQTVFKVFNVISIIVFVACIIGVIGCIIGLATLNSIPADIINLIKDEIAANIGIKISDPVKLVNVSMLIGAIACVSAGTQAKLFNLTFKYELSVGQPFDRGFAKRLLNLGLAQIIISIVFEFIIYGIVIIYISPLLGEGDGDITVSTNILPGLLIMFSSCVINLGIDKIEEKK